MPRPKGSKNSETSNCSEKRRLQNKLAQRKHREKLKRLKENTESTINSQTGFNNNNDNRTWSETNLNKKDKGMNYWEPNGKPRSDATTNNQFCCLPEISLQDNEQARPIDNQTIMSETPKAFTSLNLNFSMNESLSDQLSVLRKRLLTKWKNQMLIEIEKRVDNI